jgi:hypothetical protein
MKFSVGDKVKFLNEKGGGIVKRIIDASTVEVSIEEGFDLPVRISELIPVSTANASEKLFDVNYKVEQPAPEAKTETAPANDTAPAAPVFLARDHAQGVYLLFKPHDQRLLIAGYVDIYLINHTSYDLLYNIFLQDQGQYAGKDYGSIGPSSLALIDTCDRKSMELWMNGALQIMFHAERLDELIRTADVPFHFKSNKFLREDAYIKTNFLAGKALAIPLWTLPSEQSEKPLKKQALKKAVDDTLIMRHKVADGFAEVDLHIQALVEDTRGLNPMQMMNIQLDYLRRALDSAIAAAFEKIVFIHGVGAGVLKIELKKILDSYDFVEHYDASIAKYGIGATEVLIHKKR